MKFQPDNCIYCNTDGVPCSEVLETSLTLQLDGEKIVVKVCDAHAEEASVKTAKTAYLAKKVEFDKFLEQAKALGITIPDPAAKIAVAVGPERPQRRQQEAPQQDRQAPRNETDPTLLDEAHGFYDEDKIDRRAFSPQITADTRLSSHGVGGLQQAHDLGKTKGLLVEAGIQMGNARVRMAEASGRGGAPIPIPSTKIDGTGVTHVKVSQTMDPHKFDNRFKSMAAASKEDKVHFAKGYETDGGTFPCPMCRGSGEAVNRGQACICPKCQGCGLVS